MREETWYKMLILSTILHLVLITVFSIPIKRYSKRIDLSTSYSVNLVGDIAGSFSGEKGSDVAGGKEIKETPSKTTERFSKPAAVKKRQKPVRKETKAVSLSKQKKPAAAAKETSDNLTKEELSRLDKRISEMRRKTNYLDVTQMRASGDGARKTGVEGYGLPISGQGGSRPLDLVSQKYIFDIWDKIKNAWGLPGLSSFQKNLETIVTIKIRKDGRIVDINFEKRSGNRVYDESILRVLRSIDPLPPVPSSFNADPVELGFRFLPGDVS